MGVDASGDGRLWISGTKEFFILDKDRRRLYSAANNPEHWPVFQIRASAKKFYIDSRRRVWISARQPGLYTNTAAFGAYRASLLLRIV